MAATHGHFRLPLFCVLALLCVAAPASADSGAPTPPRAEASRPDPLCASYGKDFVRVAGSSTCIRVSGRVQADTYQGSFQSSGDALAPALRTR